MELDTLTCALSCGVYPCVCSSASANVIWVMPSRNEKLNTACNHSAASRTKGCPSGSLPCLCLQPKSDALGGGGGQGKQIWISQALSQPPPAGLLVDSTHAISSHGSDALCNNVQAPELKIRSYTVIILWAVLWVKAGASRSKHHSTGMQKDGQTAQNTHQLVTAVGLGSWTDEEMLSFTDTPNKFWGVSSDSIGIAQVWQHFLLRGTGSLYSPGAQSATAPASHAVTALQYHGSAEPLTEITQKTTNILLPPDLTGPNTNSLISYIVPVQHTHRAGEALWL